MSESNLRFSARIKHDSEEDVYMNNGALVRLVDVHKVYRTGEMEVPAA